jgi:acetylornithine deacetylase/succinyl-diaminopimelate desuccinylase-like protein
MASNNSMRIQRRVGIAITIAATAVVVTADARAEAAPDAVQAARAHRAAHGADILREFVDLLSMPNVASDSVAIRRNAAWIREHFASRGVTLSLLEVPGAPPALLGRLDSPGATRTLGIYVHYDGQPAGTETWLQNPWTPTLYAGPPQPGTPTLPLPKPGDRIDPEWRLMARSSGDDKAPLIALLAALDALRDAQLPLSSNLLFFFEGEEEAGSPHLGDFFAAYRDRINVDAWLLCDGPVHASRRPELAFGVRGITGLEMTVYGPIHGLHSGHYGNWAPNPAMLLARLLAGMKDDQGRVRIRGFYDSVEPLGPSERRALAALPATDDALRRELEFARPEGTHSLAEELLLPSLNVRGLRSGDVGADARNVIPATATASLEMRLVKGNDPEKMLDLVEAHLRREGATIVREDPDSTTRVAHPLLVKVVRQSGYPAVRTSMNHPIVGLLEQAASHASGEAVVLMPTLGGSLPLYVFTRTWDKPLVIVPIANHDDDQHAPNENLRLANLWYGIDLFAALFTLPAS